MIETISTSQALCERLRELIRREGPITFHDWMRTALYDPALGYYCREGNTKWGREGDYRTSPERSPLFAATFARYFARLYEELERPSEWTIVEAGAGDGRFAYVVLKTLQEFFPDVFAATRYFIDEVSSTSRAQARKRLQPFAERVEFRNLDDETDEWTVNPGIVFSNELLDAFPIHRVTMQNGELREFYVALGANGEFEWTLGPLSKSTIGSYLDELDFELTEGEVAEVNLEIEQWLNRVANRLRRGFLITVDYGLTAGELYVSSAAGGRGGSTLRSFHRHEIVSDVLARPGDQDLTTTVDWTFVQRAGEHLVFQLVKFERLDKFLLAAGLLDQLELESGGSYSEAAKLGLSTGAREMILPGGMAASFQVLVQNKN
jgi:SAM-dependent MidA family methyltransferase